MALLVGAGCSAPGGQQGGQQGGQPGGGEEAALGGAIVQAIGEWDAACEAEFGGDATGGRAFFLRGLTGDEAVGPTAQLLARTTGMAVDMHARSQNGQLWGQRSGLFVLTEEFRTKVGELQKLMAAPGPLRDAEDGAATAKALNARAEALGVAWRSLGKLKAAVPLEEQVRALAPSYQPITWELDGVRDEMRRLFAEAVTAHYREAIDELLEQAPDRLMLTEAGLRLDGWLHRASRETALDLNGTDGLSNLDAARSALGSALSDLPCAEGDLDDLIDQKVATLVFEEAHAAGLRAAMRHWDKVLQSVPPGEEGGLVSVEVEVIDQAKLDAIDHLFINESFDLPMKSLRAGGRAKGQPPETEEQRLARAKAQARRELKNATERLSRAELVVRKGLAVAGVPGQRKDVPTPVAEAHAWNVSYGKGVMESLEDQWKETVETAAVTRDEALQLGELRLRILRAERAFKTAVILDSLRAGPAR